jgi:hypothetical protein
LPRFHRVLFTSAAKQPNPDIVHPATFLEYDEPDGKSLRNPDDTPSETQIRPKKLYESTVHLLWRDM